jgi:hypothetical protein
VRARPKGLQGPPPVGEEFSSACRSNSDATSFSASGNRSSTWRVAIRLAICSTLSESHECATWCLAASSEVAKRRHLLLWRNVRIHLDTVQQLGNFIELEAVAPADSDLTAEHQLVQELRTALEITDERLIALGYAEQLLG